MNMTKNIFAVKPFSLMNLPNLRIIVFFKGCHNPEGWG